jgi:hypothetical protein
MNKTTTTSRRVIRQASEKRVQTNERPLRICVVFDEPGSAGCAKSLVTKVASDYECDMRRYQFDDLDAPNAGIAAAREACDTDILVLAARGDRPLPSHVRLWLGLCLALREEGQEGALVALITNAPCATERDPSIVEYLETVAIIGGVAFFSPKCDALAKSASHSSLQIRREQANTAFPRMPPQSTFPDSSRRNA